MRRQTWTDLSTFATIVQARSFTGSSHVLGVSPSALSHAMRAMEERLGVRLLNRSTRSVAPTEAGERLLASLQPAMADLDATLQRLEEDRERPAGRLRVSAHRTAALLAIAPRLPAFAAAYPDVQIELCVDDELVDIVARGFDAGVRHEHVLDLDMVSVRLTDPMRVAFVPTPDYWAYAGKPDTPEDLLSHRCLVYRLPTSGGVMRWRFDLEGQEIALEPLPALISNDVAVLRDAALRGLGVASLLEEHVAAEVADGRLEAVLADWAWVVPPNYLYYPSKRQMSTAMRAFVDAMRVA